MEILFLSLLFLACYPYLLYPAVVYLMSHVLRSHWMKGNITPVVSIVISAYNEEKVIVEKIQNTLNVRYPGLLDVVVVSDGSRDRTNELVSGFRDKGVTLKAFPRRMGKSSCLNQVVPGLRGDIVLFTDANSMFPSGTVTKIVRNFSDTRIGLVTGWTRYIGQDKKDEAPGVYGRLEMRTKCWESLVSSCVGADGAIFAIRKSLYEPLREEDINDFVIPLLVISKGKRAVLDPEVFCFEHLQQGKDNEYRRQARITNRTLGAIMRNPRCLNPFSFGVMALFIFSHKLLKFFVPFVLAGLFVTTLFLARGSLGFAAFGLLQILCVGLGLLHMQGRAKGKFTKLCSLSLITFSAQAAGWARRFRGAQDTMWTPER